PPPHRSCATWQQTFRLQSGWSTVSSTPAAPAEILPACSTYPRLPLLLLPLLAAMSPSTATAPYPASQAAPICSVPPVSASTPPRNRPRPASSSSVSASCSHPRTTAP